MKNLKSELKPIEDRVYEIESGYGAQQKRLKAVSISFRPPTPVPFKKEPENEDSPMKMEAFNAVFEKDEHFEMKSPDLPNDLKDAIPFLNEQTTLLLKYKA